MAYTQETRERTITDTQHYAQCDVCAKREPVADPTNEIFAFNSRRAPPLPSAWAVLSRQPPALYISGLLKELLIFCPECAEVVFKAYAKPS